MGAPARNRNLWSSIGFVLSMWWFFCKWRTRQVERDRYVIAVRSFQGKTNARDIPT